MEFGPPNPTFVNTSSSGKTVNIPLRIVDDILQSPFDSGFKEGSVTFAGPNGAQYRSAFISASNLAIGDELNGTYLIALSFPRYSASGTWTVHAVVLEDVTGNSRSLDRTDLLDLDLTDFHLNVQVASIPDTTPPVYSGIGFSPQTFDTSTSDVWADLRLYITDDLSGFTFGWVRFESQSKRQKRLAYFSYRSLTSGDTLAGWYSIPVIWQQYSESGSWKWSFYAFYDAAGNRVYGTPWIWPTVQVSSSPEDLQAPVQVDITRSPSSIDTSGSSATVTLTLTITDNLAGFTYARVWYRSPSGEQSQWAHIYPAHKVSGTVYNGVYQYDFTFPQYSESGTWSLYWVTLWDRVNNSVSYREYCGELDAFNLDLEVVG